MTPSRKTSPRLRVALLAFSATILTACAREAPPDTSVTRTVERDGTTMTVHVERGAVEAGEPLRLTLSVAGAPDVHPPRLEATLGPFDVRPVPSPVGQGVPNDQRIAVYELSTLETGDLAIPPIELALGTDADAPTLATESIPITVASLLGGDENPGNYRDIKGVVDIPLPVDALGAATYAAIGLGAVLTLAWGWFMLRRSSRALALLPADQRAMRDLAALEAKRLPATGRVHEYFVELTDIVRTYIERRFGIRAPELTTPEFLGEARRSSAISDEHQRLLAGFLRGADLVKFGGARPTLSQCEESMQHARTFVRDSAPKPDDATSADAGSSAPGIGVPA